MDGRLINFKHTYHLLWLFTGLVLLSSCDQVVVTVDAVPSNTPQGQPIYIAGNFNNWDPGDQRYQLTMGNDSVYRITLPRGFGRVEYKFTRGDWTTVEKDICGYEIDNRSLKIGAQDTVSNQIESWNDQDPVDCPRLTLVVDKIPKDTPENDILAIAGNFNDWLPDYETRLQKDSNTGMYLLTINRPPDISKLEFKVTRGDLSTSESDEFGNVLPNRIAEFGKSDTVKLNIDGWIDSPEKNESNRVIFLLTDIPPNTPASDEFFLVSNLNNWTPYDRNYIFQRDKNGNYFYPFPRKKKILEFKITRGNWGTCEVDRYGYEIPNRRVNLENVDTVEVSIAAWKDRGNTYDPELTVVLNKLPETTPENPRIYIAGNFNNWNTDERQYRFKKSNNGVWFVNIPRNQQEMECLVTRGSWDNAEVNQYGSSAVNRRITMRDYDTVYFDVANWKDRPPRPFTDVTLVIDKLPANTPVLDDIYLAPSFNGWNPEDENLIFGRLMDGKPFITISPHGRNFEYKITRGGWGTVEVDEYGNSTSDRQLSFGFADTVYIQVVKWRDLEGNY